MKRFFQPAILLEGAGIIPRRCIVRVHKGRCDKEYWCREAATRGKVVKVTSCRGRFQDRYRSTGTRRRRFLKFNALLALVV